MNRSGWAGFRWGAWVLAALLTGVMLPAPRMRAEAAAQAARLSSVEGQVRIAQSGQLPADPALVNTPLFEGFQVMTGEDGRAELQFDDGSLVRLSPNSSLTLSVLRGQGASGEVEIALTGGLGYFELQGGAAPFRVRFGDSVVTASGSTVLRVNLDNPPGELAVFSGDAHLERGTALAADLHGGESVLLNPADPAQYALDDAIEPDSWDAWNSDRDQALAGAASARTGAANSQPENNHPAWNDLDANGNWYNVPGQGNVWSPYDAAAPGWDPYGNGNWVWTPRFGYIWVSGDAWGYLPFQCGAWNYYGGFGWGWAPGMCQPWWGGGFWISTIGRGPGGYRPPLRPHPMPVRGGLHPTVAVNLRPPSGTGTLPVRDRSASVTIAGHVVQPLRPVAPRPQYGRPVSTGTVTRTQPAYTGAKPPVAAPHPATGTVSSGNHPSGGAPAARPSSGGGSSHASPAGHASSGGGGGGGVGGGGAHSSGGGGGHH